MTMTLQEAVAYFEDCGFVGDGASGNEAWAVIKTALAELGTTPNSANTKLRKIIIELGCRGVLGASERDTAIVDDICKREGIVL